MYRIAFKLPADTEADFGIVNVYIFADNDRTTGRKNMGNEYFLDVTKSMVSTYSADGKGTLHRKAVTAVRDGEWYILSFSKNLAPDTPTVLDCRLDMDEFVLPMIPPGGSVQDLITGRN